MKPDDFGDLLPSHLPWYVSFFRDLAKKLLVESSYNLVQRFMVPWWWILLMFVIPWLFSSTTSRLNFSLSANNIYIEYIIWPHLSEGHSWCPEGEPEPTEVLPWVFHQYYICVRLKCLDNYFMDCNLLWKSGSSLTTKLHVTFNQHKRVQMMIDFLFLSDLLCLDTASQSC